MQSQVFTGVTSLFVLLQPKTRQMEEPEDHPILEDLKSRIILCSKLGLTTQLDTLLGYYKAFYLRRTVPIPYPFLIGDQERFLRELFPTPYMQPDARRREHPFVYLIARWGDALLSWEQLARQLPRSARATLEMTAPPGLLPGEPMVLLEDSNEV